MDALPHRLTLLVAISFVALATAMTWPLPLHLGSHLTGLPGGDTGVYLWNIWVFRHQLVELHQSPYWTDVVLPVGGPANLALHNYTPFANLLALPLQPVLGVIATFNVVYVVNMALCALGMFLLAHRVTGRVAESWMAGAMFAAAPFLIARGTSHFSLAAAAPLPVFAYFFDRAWRSSRLSDGAAAGITTAWAFYCDPYYAVYTVLLGGAIAAARLVALRRVPATPASRRLSRTLEGTAAAGVLAMALVHGAADGSLPLGPLTVSMHTLYTPVLLVSLLLTARALVHVRATVHLDRRPARALALATTAAVAAAAALVPAIHALASMAANDRLTGAPVLWRSSAPGADLLSFFLPNPNHPWAPDALTSWIAAQPGRFEENVVSISYVALAVVAAAWRWAGVRPAIVWTCVTLGFASLALGPFVHVGGQLTYVPTPWTFLRYVPLIGEARMPQRFAVLVFLGLTVLFAAALSGLTRMFPAKRRMLLVLIGAALAVELQAAPRPLAVVDVPQVYRTLARDQRPLRVLELPIGVRDGLSSLGDFSAYSLVYQTVHEKGLVGGYLSRVDDRTKRAYDRQPALAALLTLSGGATPPVAALAAGRAAAPALVHDLEIGYVVIDTARTPPRLQQFAIDALALERVEADGSFVLYTTPVGRE